MMDMMIKAFPLLANLLADELGITVVWMAGVPPHADRERGRIVLSPDVEPTAALGLLIHEAGHFKHTNDVEWKKRIDGDKTRHAFGNAVEDIWMEREVIRMYPGARKRLNDLLVSLQKQGRIKNGRHPVIDYFHTKLRADHLGQSMEPALLSEATDIFVATFGDQKKDELDVLLDDIVHVDSTEKCFDLSERIMALFNEDQQDSEEQSKESQSGEESRDDDSGQSGEKSDEQTGENTGDDSGKQSGDDSGDQSGEQQSGGNPGESEEQPDGGESGEQSGDSGADADGQSGGDSSEQSGDQAGDSGGQYGSNSNGQSEEKVGEQSEKSGKHSDQQSDDASQGGESGQGANKGAVEDFTFQGVGEMIMEAIEEAMSEAEAEAKTGHAGRQGEGKGGGCNTSLKSEGEMYDVPVSYEKGFHPKIQPPSETAQLRRGLSALLQGETLVKQRASLCGKKVVPTKLWSTKYGGRAFKSVTQGVKRNAAIHLSLDVSGSMQGTPIQVAKKAVLSVASAVEKTPGVDVVVSTFGSDIKVLSKPAAIAKAVAYGGTAMAPAVKTAGMQLIKSSKDRKILLVVTDGEPHQPAWTRRMIEACQASGIVVVGVGIGTRAVENLFDNHIVINDVAELPKTLLGCLRNIL